MRDFRRFEIWKTAMTIAKMVYDLSALLPSSEKFGFGSQIQRAAVSIPSNVAEGSSRASEKDFKRFLEISLGSCYELETQITLIKDIGLIQETTLLDSVLKLIIEEQKMLNGFIARIKLDNL